MSVRRAIFGRCDAYLLINRIVAERGAPVAQRARWNEAFDRTTLAFFGGDYAKVLREMHALAGEKLGGSALEEGWGHTLVVGVALDRALTFFFAEDGNP